MDLFDVRNEETGLGKDLFQELVDGADLLVGFNLKYDLHWLSRIGVTFNGKKIWCCQTAHFILRNQRTPYPSLNDACEFYGIPGKFGFIEENYWSKGIDTPDIPKKEMLTYLEQDLKCTWEVYQRQLKELEGNSKLLNLVRMDMDDLLVLQDMEWNGLRMNLEECAKQEQQVAGRIKEIETELNRRYPNTPINWDSGEHVSAYFYGGTIEIDRKEPVGLFKSGNKVGQVRYRHVTDLYPLLRLVEPPEGSELKKEGVWSTAEDVLKQVKQLKEIKLYLERAELSKLLDYLTGWPKLMKEKDWKGNEVHGQFNQVVARTGRLSSSSPNLQNLPDPMLRLIETRYS